MADELLLTPKERQKVCDKVRVLPHKRVLDAYLEAQLAKALKQRLDRPDREKIARTPVETHKYLGKRYLTLDSIDQLLPLIPDIEEAKKQERERIIAEIEELDKKVPGYITFEEALKHPKERAVIRIYLEDWQALREGK